MKPPRRWVDDLDELSEDERRALAAARAVRPRAEFVDGVYAALLAEIPFGPPGSNGAGSSGPIDPGAAGAGTAGAVGATGATGAAGTASAVGVAGAVGAIKAAAIGASIGALVLTGRAVIVSEPVRPAAVQTSSQTAPTIANAERTRASEKAVTRPQANGDRRNIEPSPVEATPVPTSEPARPTEAADRSAEPRATGSGRVTPESAATPNVGAAVPSPRPGAAGDPFEETRLVASARESLRKGDWSSAMALLDQAAAKFPRGVLLEEREALAIEGLVESGQRARAIEHADAFFRSHPESPHAARVRAVIAAP